MSYYSKPPARFAGMDPMDMAKAAAIEREERRERMEQAEKDLRTVKAYLDQVAYRLRRRSDDTSIPVALQSLLWKEKVEEVSAILWGLRTTITQGGPKPLTLSLARRAVPLERRESDAEAVPDTDARQDVAVGADRDGHA